MEIPPIVGTESDALVESMFPAALIAASAAGLFFVVLGLVQEPNNAWAGFALVVAFGVSFANIVFIGIPLTFLLRRYKLLNAVSMLISGFVTGALFYAAFAALFSPRGSEYSYQVNSEWLVVNGVTTSAGWHQHLASAFEVGIFGAAVSATYYAALRILSRCRTH